MKFRLVSDPTSFTSQVLGSQVCAIMPGFIGNFFITMYQVIYKYAFIEVKGEIKDWRFISVEVMHDVENVKISQRKTTRFS